MLALGFALSLAGAGLLYAGSAHQQAWRRGGRHPRVLALGAALLLAALVPLFATAGPATALFIWSTAAALAWTIVPLAAAWRRSRRAGS